MIKIKQALFLILILAWNADAFSAEKVQYCPDTIVCDKGNIIYCHPSGAKDEGWDGIAMVASDRRIVFSGVYNFINAQALYHSRKVETPASCYYKGSHSRYGSTTLVLSYNKLASIEIYNSQDSKWKISKDRGGCASRTTKDCPLTESSAFYLTNRNIDSNVRLGGIKDILPNTTIKIRYEDALACKDSTLCNLPITTGHGGTIGHVVFDLTDKLKILKVTSLRSYEIEARKVDNFNAVEVFYHN